MNCPACNTAMMAQDFGGVVIDICQSCKGLWLDWMELIKIDERHEGSGQALAAAMLSPRSNPPNRGQIPCPKCGIPMRIHNYGRAQSVKVDECYGCGGFFLDSGELRMIREEYMTDAEHASFVETLVDDVPGSGDYRDDLEKRFVRGKAMLRMTRLLRPSWIAPKLLGATPQEDVSLVLPGLLEKQRRDPEAVRTPELRAYLEKCRATPEAARSPEQRALIEVYGAC